MEEMERRIAQGLDFYGLDVTKAPVLAEYGERLLEKNRVMNLTAITDPLEVASLHMLDCAALCSRWDLSAGRLIDVGTGAGFPGLVLAILCPQLQVTLLDPLQKRLDFLSEVCKGLSLYNVEVLHQRGEDAGRDPALREQFDFATARAVADLTVLAELCLPLARVGGTFLAMKSVGSDGEAAHAAQTVKALGGKALESWDYPVYPTEVTHRVYPIRKVSHTPEQYPRKWSKIKPKKIG